MSKIVTVAEAKTHISALLSEVEAGNEVTITRYGRPVAKLIAAPSGTVNRPAGEWDWRGEYDPAVFAPMTEQEMREEGWP